MGNRRMFSKTVVQSVKFLNMSEAAQALYLQLGIDADDDGVVEASIVMRIVRAADETMQELISQGFVTLLDEKDLIVYLNDWQENNTIRSDRKKDSRYKELLQRVLPDVKLVEARPGYYARKNTFCQTNDRQETDICQTNDRLSKDNISKDNISKDNLSKDNLSKNNKDPVIYFPEDELLNNAFMDYLEMRKAIKKPATEKAIELAISKLKKLSSGPFDDSMDNNLAIEILNQSTMCNWAGLFPLKNYEQGKNGNGQIDWSKV